MQRETKKNSARLEIGKGKKKLPVHTCTFLRDMLENISRDCEFENAVPGVEVGVFIKCSLAFGT